jgi:hypothetical protein
MGLLKHALSLRKLKPARGISYCSAAIALFSQTLNNLSGLGLTLLSDVKDGTPLQEKNLPVA